MHQACMSTAKVSLPSEASPCGLAAVRFAGEALPAVVGGQGLPVFRQVPGSEGHPHRHLAFD